MTNDDVELLGRAKTLVELQALIAQAIDRAGPEATWNGFDDEAIYIYAADGRTLKIESGTTV